MDDMPSHDAAATGRFGPGRVLSVSAKYANYSLGLSVTNVWNTQPIVVNSGGLYIFQTRRAFQASFKARF